MKEEILKVHMTPLRKGVKLQYSGLSRMDSLPFMVIYSRKWKGREIYPKFEPMP